MKHLLDRLSLWWLVRRAKPLVWAGLPGAAGQEPSQWVVEPYCGRWIVRDQYGYVLDHVASERISGPVFSQFPTREIAEAVKRWAEGGK